jgi:hypothetical protein
MHSLVVETLEGARKHRQLLADALSASQGTVRIASAYVTEASLFPGRPKRKTQLLTSLSREDVVFGATSLIALESLIGAGAKARGFTPRSTFLAIRRPWSRRRTLRETHLTQISR